MVYLGRGIFAELCKCAEPLVEIEGDANVMSLVIGTLTSNEQTVIDKLSKLGLGFAVDRTAANDNKPSTSSITGDQRHEGKCTTEISPKSTEVQHLADIPSVTVNVELLKLALTDKSTGDT